MSAVVASRVVRGVCDTCGYSEKLRANGTVGNHPTNGPRCAGVGQAPRGSKSRKTKSRKTKVPAATVPTPEVVVGNTYVGAALDTSGSMYGIMDIATDALYRSLFPLKNEQNYFVSLRTFSWGVVNHFTCQRPQNIRRFSFTADGGTALNDAIMETIREFKDTERKDPSASFLVIAFTDGYENRSSVPTFKLRAEILKLQDKGNWTFAISCPKGSETRIAKAYGIPHGNVTSWEQTEEGVEELAQVNTNSVTNYTRSRATGSRSVSSFYVQVGRKNVDEVARTLTSEKSSRYRTIRAEKACTIQEAVEGKKLRFSPGCAYYQLNKPETIQSYKQIIMQRRDTGDFYTGFTETRNALGLPLDGHGKVHPGNLGEWIIWVQSTSNNRKLLSGMQILFDKQH